MTTTTPTINDGPLQPATTKAPSAAALLSIGGRQALVALRLLLAMTVIVGIVYPLVVLGIGQLATTSAANGSLVTDSSGAVVGSSLIGQQFDASQGNSAQGNSAQWFVGRPSAAGDGYDAMSSGGSNLAADSSVLLDQVNQRRAQIAADDGVDPASVPPDALTASGSGLDPDISQAYALIQVDRVAAARGLTADQVSALVQSHTQQPLLGFIGEQRVNVLELNLALQQLAPAASN